MLTKYQHTNTLQQQSTVTQDLHLCHIETLDIIYHNRSAPFLKHDLKCELTSSAYPACEPACGSSLVQACIYASRLVKYQGGYLYLLNAGQYDTIQQSMNILCPVKMLDFGRPPLVQIGGKSFAVMISI